MGRPKKKYEEVQKIFKNQGYKLLDAECNGAHQLLRYTCQKHQDKELKTSWSNMEKGHGCPYCARESVKHSYQSVKQAFENREYSLVSTEYIKAGLLLEYTCNKHPDNIQKITFNNLLSGHGCAYCAGNTKFTYEEIRRIFEEKGYELVSNKYVNSKTNMQYICIKHPTHIQKISIDNLRAGKGCQDCWDGRNSKLSKLIEKALIERNITFYKEHRFNDCRLELPLAFDFYLPYYNTCIEVDGQQHFNPVTFGGISIDKAKIEFERTIKRDKVKNDYCKSNGIRLIRIPYFDSDKIENIIKEIKTLT